MAQHQDFQCHLLRCANFNRIRNLLSYIIGFIFNLPTFITVIWYSDQFPASFQHGSHQTVLLYSHTIGKHIKITVWYLQVIWFLSSHFRTNIIKADLQSQAQPSKSLETPWQLGQKRPPPFSFLLLPCKWPPTATHPSSSRFFNLPAAVELLGRAGVTAPWDGRVLLPQQRFIQRGLNRQR